MENELVFTTKTNEVVVKTEAEVVSLLVAWALSGEELSEADADCIANAKATFEGSFKLRELVFEAMRRVELGSAAWKRLFKIA